MYFAFSLLVIGVLAPLVARADTPYQNELELLKAGHSNHAYSLLRPKLAGSAGNPVFDTAFGLAALDSGATAEAIAAFERVLAVQPANLPVRTELARAYENIGDTSAANRELQAVASHPQTPADVRANLSRYASVLDETLGGGPRVIRATVTAAAGYDSNINTATTSSYLVVPALASLGPARLDDGSRAQDSAFAEVGAELFVRQPLTMSRALFARVSAEKKTPFETSDYMQTTLMAEGGVQLTSPDHGRVTAGVSVQQFWFGGEDYSRTYALSGNWLKPLNATANLTTYATLSHIEYTANSAQNANRGVVGISVDNRWRGGITPYVFGGVYGGAEKANDAAYASYELAGAMAGVEIFPWEKASLFADVRYEVRSYDGEFPMFFTERSDRQLDVGFGAAIALSDTLSLRPRVSYRNADSNIGFYDYSRWLAQIGLRYTL